MNDATLNVRAPDRLLDALDRATTNFMTTRSEYVRQAVLDKLRRDGVALVRAEQPATRQQESTV